MSNTVSDRRLVIHYMVPPACLLLSLFIRYGGVESRPEGTVPLVALAFIAIALIVSTVFSALHHAEAIASRLGEPYGTLVLTLAVTAIEVSIIVSMMLHGDSNPTLARESVFSTVMIVCSGVVGICLTLGGWRHTRQDISKQGTSALLSVVIATSVLTMILPNYTLTTAPGTFSPTQLFMVSALALLLYGSFLFSQTFGTRTDAWDEYVLEEEQRKHPSETAGVTRHVLFLFVGLTGFVLLAEEVAARIEELLVHLDVVQSDAIVGALISFVVLLPEAISAVKASLKNELQRGLNVALGSACATTGLTIPAVAAASLITGRPLTLGLDSGDTVLLLLTLFISAISFSTGRTTVLTGLSHLVICAAYALLVFVP